MADMVKVKAYIDGRDCTLIGPNCPGIITAGQAKVGIMPGFIFEPGVVGIVSKSGTSRTKRWTSAPKRPGQTTAIGIGGDPIIGTTTLEAVKLLMADDETKGIVMIGEIGGDLEVQAARWIQEATVGFIAAPRPDHGPQGHRVGQEWPKLMRECASTSGQPDIGSKMAEVLGSVAEQKPGHVAFCGGVMERPASQINTTTHDFVLKQYQPGRSKRTLGALVVFLGFRRLAAPREGVAQADVERCSWNCKGQRWLVARPIQNSTGCWMSEPSRAEYGHWRIGILFQPNPRDRGPLFAAHRSVHSPTWPKMSARTTRMGRCLGNKRGPETLRFTRVHPGASHQMCRRHAVLFNQPEPKRIQLWICSGGRENDRVVLCSLQTVREN